MLKATAGYRSPSAHYAPAWRCFVFFEEAQARTPTVSGMPSTRARPMRQWLGITQNGSDWRMLLGPLRSSLLSFLNETQRGERIARRSRAVANRGRRQCPVAADSRDFAGRRTCEFCELRFHTPISLLTPYNSAVASCCVWIHPGAWERSRGRALQYAPHSAIVPDM